MDEKNSRKTKERRSMEKKIRRICQIKRNRRRIIQRNPISIRN